MKALARWAETHLDYRFEDATLLECAFTHRSASRQNYERLEFLGDAFLNYSIGARLYELHPEYTEGELSRARASLVNQSTLAAIAKGIDLGPHIILGGGEMRTGGAQRSSVLSDVVEAIIGAVLLDGSHRDAASLILRLYTDRIQTLPEPDELKDSKTRLQEWLQGRGEALPCYRVEQISGKDHEQVFLVRCELGDETKSSVGKGRSRRRAEQVAAAALLADLIGEHGE